ncbi:hypothetical protein [Microbacterium arborescens]|uniref:hypothetical protein n=1 Tax=Microbacterium arborescens TaxID=33883 RepID=UPI003C7694E7
MSRELFLLALGLLVVFAAAATIVVASRDGYRRIPTDPTRLPLRRRRGAGTPRRLSRRQAEAGEGRVGDAAARGATARGPQPRGSQTAPAGRVSARGA